MNDLCVLGDMQVVDHSKVHQVLCFNVLNSKHCMHRTDHQYLKLKEHDGKKGKNIKKPHSAMA